MTDLLKNIGLDRYDINARLKPALLAVLPVLIPGLYWYPDAWSAAGSAVAAASSCGGLYAMSQLARRRGRAIERRMGSEVGRDHSARLLSHADTFVVPDTKARYHAHLRSCGHNLASAEEEIADPNRSFLRARSAVDWLLENTPKSGRAPLLFEENVAYGFQRNQYGLKPIAITICLVAIVAHAGLLAKSAPPTEWSGSGIGVLIVLAALLAYWTVAVTRGAVIDASLAYGQRLLSLCETSAPAKPRATSKTQPTAKAPRKRKSPASAEAPAE